MDNQVVPSRRFHGDHIHKNRVMIIGLDSADWSILDQPLASGQLPNLTKIIKSGLCSDLGTVVPDMTPPAWTSFVTGVNPARHNVYGFFQPIRNQIQLTTSKFRRAPAIWEMISPECVKVLVNIPLTYPVAPVNGCMVSDSLTLRKDGEWTWPNEEKSGLLKLGYDKCLLQDITEAKSLRQLEDSVDARMDSFRYLLKKYEWCLSMIVFSESDWVQHLFPGDVRSILKIYQRIDRFFGEIYEDKSPIKSLLIIASDHGYSLAKRKFLVNNWLIRSGLLTFNESRSRFDKVKSPVITQGANIAPRIFKLIPRRLSLSVAVKVRNPANSLNLLKGVYAIGWDLGQYLRLHLTDEEKANYELYYNKLIDESKKLTDPKTGKSPIKKVIRKGEVYDGPYLASAPDFVLELDSDYSGIERIFKSLGLFLDYKVGMHRRQGILISKWLNSTKTVKTDRKDVNSILDVAPTIVEILGKRQIRTDGKVISKILEKPLFHS